MSSVFALTCVAIPAKPMCVCVSPESGGSAATPRRQQEPDPGAGADIDGRRRAGRTDPTKTRRFQHAVGRADGEGETRSEASPVL